MPWIYEKVAAPSGLVIEHDHQTLMAEMDEITRVAADKTIEAGGRLTVLLRTFAAGMSKHLANEEMYVPQMLRESGYTQEDEQALVGKVMQSLSPKAFATMMPLIFYAMEKAGGYGPSPPRSSSAPCRRQCRKRIRRGRPPSRATFWASSRHFARQTPA